jgi:hypothetical protein
MTFGCYAYGSVAYAGRKVIVQCSAPSANLVVMENLLRIGYTQEEISRLHEYIDLM